MVCSAARENFSGSPRRGGAGEAVADGLAEAVGGDRNHRDGGGTGGIQRAQRPEQARRRLRDVAGRAQVQRGARVRKADRAPLPEQQHGLAGLDLTASRRTRARGA